MYLEVSTMHSAAIPTGAPHLGTPHHVSNGVTSSAWKTSAA